MELPGYGGPIANLGELKTSITQEIQNITSQTLQSVVKLFSLKRKMLGQIIDYFSSSQSWLPFLDSFHHFLLFQRFSARDS